MTLNELKHAIDQLSPVERAELGEYISLRSPHPWSARERIRRVHEAAAFIRESMTQEQLEAAIAAMEDDYIEPWDEEEWQF